MNKQTARERLMDYLYGEISDTEKQKLETYLADHPDLQKELDELRETHSLLQQMPEIQAAEKLLIVEPHERSAADWWQNAKSVFPQSGWAKAALATAACLVLLLLAGSVANLNIHSTENGFSVSMGYADVPQSSALSEAQTEAVIQKIKRENTAMMAEYADILNQHNQQQLQQVVEYFERQRLNDLQLIDQALNQYQQATDYQLQQTNQVLGEVLQTVASNDQQ